MSILQDLGLDSHKIKIGYTGTIDPGFEPHQCLLLGMWRRVSWLSHWLPRDQQVSHQRCTIFLYEVQIRLPTLALKPRGDAIRSPKQWYQWFHKKDLCPPPFFIPKNWIQKNFCQSSPYKFNKIE